MTASHRTLCLPRVPKHCMSSDHVFCVLLPVLPARDALLGGLKAEGIHAVFHYVPLHSSPMGRKLGCAGAPLPLTDDLAARVVRLPMYYEITDKKQGRVADGLTAWCEALPRTAPE